MIISVFRHIYDKNPQHHSLDWAGLVKLLTTFATRKDKDGPLWSPARYPDGATRSNSNVIDLCGLPVDIDEGASPDDFTEMWDSIGIAYIVYSTWHHLRAKPGHPDPAPRWRAVFPLAAPIAALQWSTAYPRLATYLAGTLWDPACSDPSRMHYLPATLPDQPTLTLVHEGRFLELSEAPELPPPIRKSPTNGHGTRRAAKEGDPPGKDYSERGDHVAVLERAGWTYAFTRGSNEHWTRPGKKKGTSGTWSTSLRRFHCFSSSTDLKAERGISYDLFGLRIALENSTASDMARQLVREGYGTPLTLIPEPPSYDDIPPPTDDDAPPDALPEKDEQSDPPPPTDDDAPAEAIPLSAAPPLPAGLPAREDVARWAGYVAQTAQRAPMIMEAVGASLRDAYQSGVGVALSGGRINKPVDICDTDARRFKRVLIGQPTRAEKPPFELPITIARLIRRPVNNRATFDMNLDHAGRTAALTHLDGSIIGNYIAIRALALEHCIPMPSNCKDARDAWDALLAEAFSRVEQAAVEVEESPLLAVRQEIAYILMDSEVMEKDDREDELKRGKVAQDEKGETLYVWPRMLVSRVRSRLDADKPSREQVSDAAKMLNMTPARPTLSDGKRPRTWSFPVEELKKWV